MDENRKYLAGAFMDLPQPKYRIQCEYVWIDGSLRNLRTKSKTWPSVPHRAEEMPIMEFCGSATDFDVGNEADYYSHPAKIYRDPFRLGLNRLIFCETRTRDGLPTFANNRHRLRQARKKGVNNVTDFSFYQPYSLQRANGKLLSYMEPAYSAETKSGFLCGQVVAESHYKACLYAGIKIKSMEPVSNQGQWKYEIGPSSCVDLGDDVWMSRYLLLRIAEDFGVTVSFDISREHSNLKCSESSSEIHFTTDHLTQAYRQKIIDDLFARFGISDNPLNIVTRPHKIALKDINSDVDPYFILTRVLEAICF